MYKMLKPRRNKEIQKKTLIKRKESEIEIIYRSLNKGYKFELKP